MSAITYNGVGLPYAFTTQFQQEALYDDVGQTDWYLTKFDIQAQAVVNANYISLLAPDLAVEGASANAANIMQAVRTRLLQPRRELSVTFNGHELIPQPTAGQQGVVDARNGPMPQSCNIVQLNNETFLILYHIIAHYWECNEVRGAGSGPLVQNTEGNNVLFNRWSEIVDIDNRNFSKRIREGKFAIRSDNKDGMIADMARRQMAVVGVPKGFLRESSTYIISPDGLTVAYRIVDREVFKLPPAPAFEASGEYIESASHRGAKRWGEVRVNLKGDLVTDQTLLIEKAIAVAVSKLTINGAMTSQLAKGFTLLESASVMVKMYDNEVEVRMRVLMKPKTDKTGKGRKRGVWGMDFAGMAFTPFSEPGDMPPYLDRGTTPLLLQAAAYFDPCFESQLNPTTGQMDRGLAPGTAGETFESETATTPGMPSVPDHFLTEQQDVNRLQVIRRPDLNPDDMLAKYQDLSPDQSIFIDYDIQSRYEGDRHIYMMGLSSPEGAAQNDRSAAFVQLASPTLLWIVDWSVAKWAEAPEYPNSFPNPAGPWVLLDEHYEPTMLMLATDGVTALYRISGTYVYGHKNPDPLDLSSHVQFSRPAWMLDTFDRSLPTSKKTPDLFGLEDEDPRPNP